MLLTLIYYRVELQERCMWIKNCVRCSIISAKFVLRPKFCLSHPTITSKNIVIGTNSSRRVSALLLSPSSSLADQHRSLQVGSRKSLIS